MVHFEVCGWTDPPSGWSPDWCWSTWHILARPGLLAFHDRAFNDVLKDSYFEQLMPGHLSVRRLYRTVLCEHSFQLADDHAVSTHTCENPAVERMPPNHILQPFNHIYIPYIYNLSINYRYLTMYSSLKRSRDVNHQISDCTWRRYITRGNPASQTCVMFFSVGL